MLIDIQVPQAGESITQVELARWLVTNGQYVEKDQDLAEIDSDKATLTVIAAQPGVVSILMDEGSSTKPGDVIGTIDTSAKKPSNTKKEEGTNDAGQTLQADNLQKPSGDEAGMQFSPQAKKLLNEWNIDPLATAAKTEGRRITKKDILAAIAADYWKRTGTSQTDPPVISDGPSERKWGGTRREDRQKMSTLRRKIAERLVAVKNQTAMLTTFNEIDMSAIIAIRSDYQDAFMEKYGYKLGFMSFFARAVALAIPYFPQVNAYIENEFMVIPDYADIGIAVSTPKGLMVPVIRNAETLSIPELEEKIQQMANKARDGKISLEDIRGGSISITNGGVFGSLLSTPIINPPQSAILGMHNIQDRPVAVNGKIVIRPMMYVALSYDHRIIDGRESVGFLIKVKNLLENPLSMLQTEKSPGSQLLGL